jgi:uncharacterized protein (DUF2147 family)
MQRIIKKTKLLLGIMLLTIFTASAQNVDKITGKWKDADHPEKQMEMYKQDKKYFAKYINDKNTPSKNGSFVFKDLVWNENTRKYQGVLINPDNNKEMKIAIELVGDNDFKFTVSKFIFSKTFNFKRLN